MMRSDSYVSQYFLDSWVKGVKGKLLKIVPLPVSPARVTAYDRYCEALTQKSAAVNRSLLFHGLGWSCDGLNSAAAAPTLCTSTNCSVCSICANGMDASRIGTGKASLEMSKAAVGFLRFGRGYYFAPNSSKAHDYACKYTRVINGVPMCVQLVCEVAAGNPAILAANCTTLTAPPPGHDSVYGIRGRALNYPELVVYNPDAVLPVFAVIYEAADS